jgi:hypothetical protein
LRYYYHVVPLKWSDLAHSYSKEGTIVPMISYPRSNHWQQLFINRFRVFSWGAVSRHSAFAGMTLTHPRPNTRTKKLFCQPETPKMLPPLRTSIRANVRRRHLTGLSQVSFATNKCKVDGFFEHFFKGDLVYADMLVKELNPVFDY